MDERPRGAEENVERGSWKSPEMPAPNVIDAVENEESGGRVPRLELTDRWRFMGAMKES